MRTLKLALAAALTFAAVTTAQAEDRRVIPAVKAAEMYVGILALKFAGLPADLNVGYPEWLVRREMALATVVVNYAADIGRVRTAMNDLYTLRGNPEGMRAAYYAALAEAKTNAAK